MHLLLCGTTRLQDRRVQLHCRLALTILQLPWHPLTMLSHLTPKLIDACAVVSLATCRHFEPPVLHRSRQVSIPPANRVPTVLFGSLLQSQHELWGMLLGVRYQVLKALHLCEPADAALL